MLNLNHTGTPDEKRGEIVKAVIQPKPGMMPAREEITDLCREKLTRYKVPREIEFGEVPRSSTGKILKAVLKERERESAEAASPAL
jgi:fatty-acyl-CoA synthase